MLARTPYITIISAGIITAVTLLLIVDPSRPFTQLQTLLFYFTALLPSLGVALLFDPVSANAKAEYLKINFYAEKKE
jgi:hypothetical protein